MRKTLSILCTCLLLAAPAAADLLITEVFYDQFGADGDGEWVEIMNTGDEAVDLTGWQLCAGGTSYAYSVNVLSGTIDPCQVFVIGGPLSDADNGFPAYDLVLDFMPDIQNGGSATDAVALFEPGADPATACPVSAVLYGGENTSGLLDDACAAGAPQVDDAPSGSSIERTTLTPATWSVNDVPAPGVVDYTCGGTPAEAVSWGTLKSAYR